ncbi:hypothetical protein [Flagellimonas allohymeniacidonis]|uniref:Cadherin domain-containing protein n=1 Tax=Flagellimonas allohymeniacidonis TaxID=2517819 RepID=A0A4Q8QLI2_9FLAO|nr:hypothetical protein [Allomuricauda hymeniacidonis]TAI49409.1 hypothetical protein EW142_06315 [Allomuricauda hymeniacidonis]
MKRILLCCSALFFAFLSCDSSSEDPTDEGPVQTTDDDISQPDGTAPTITISSVPDVIEVITEFNLQITDESDQVTTTFSLDGVEIFQSNQKNFTFELDPFDFDSGAKTLEVKSIDDGGNEGSATVTFELRKLLVSYPDPFRRFDQSTTEAYLAINNLEGELVMFQKIESEEDGILYAPDGFERQNFVLTRYLVRDSPGDFLILDSFGGIEPGTFLLSEEEVEAKFNSVLTKDQSVDIVVNSDRTAELNSYHASLVNMGPPGSDNYTLNYASGAASNFLMRLEPSSSPPINDYSYLFIDDLTKQNYNDSDFIRPETLQTLSIPEGKSFSFSLNGYANQMDYQQNRFQRIYEESGGLAGTDAEVPVVSQSIEVPVILDFDVFKKSTVVNRPGGITWFIDQKGLNPFSIPNLDISRTGGTLVITGEFNFIRHNLFIPANATGNGSSSFFWTFTDTSDDTKEIPFVSTFEFPEPIQNVVTLKSIEVNPENTDPSTYTTTVYAYENEINYTDLVLTSVFLNNEAGDSFRIQLILEQ